MKVKEALSSIFEKQTILFFEGFNRFNNLELLKKEYELVFFNLLIKLLFFISAFNDSKSSIFMTNDVFFGIKSFSSLVLSKLESQPLSNKIVVMKKK